MERLDVITGVSTFYFVLGNNSARKLAKDKNLYLHYKSAAIT
jgi:hypothetical protein